MQLPVHLKVPTSDSQKVRPVLGSVPRNMCFVVLVSSTSSVRCYQKLLEFGGKIYMQANWKFNFDF